MKSNDNCKRKVEDYFIGNEWKKVKFDNPNNQHHESNEDESKKLNDKHSILQLKDSVNDKRILKLIDSDHMMAGSCSLNKAGHDVNLFPLQDLHPNLVGQIFNSPVGNIDNPVISDHKEEVITPEDEDKSLLDMFSPSKFKEEEEQIGVCINQDENKASLEQFKLDEISSSGNNDSFKKFINQMNSAQNSLSDQFELNETHNKISVINGGDQSFDSYNHHSETKHTENEKPSFFPKIESIYSTNIKNFESGLFFKEVHPEKRKAIKPKIAPNIKKRNADVRLSYNVYSKCHICNVSFKTEDEWLWHINSSEHQTSFKHFKQKLGIPVSPNAKNFKLESLHKKYSPKTSKLKSNRLMLGNKADVLKPVNFKPLNLINRRIIICAKNRDDNTLGEFIPQSKIYSNHIKSKPNSSNAINMDNIEATADSNLPVVFIPYHVRVKTLNNETKVVLMYLPYFDEESSFNFMKECWSVPSDSWVGEVEEPVRSIINVNFNSPDLPVDKELFVSRVIAPLGAIPAPVPPHHHQDEDKPCVNKHLIYNKLKSKQAANSVTDGVCKKQTELVTSETESAENKENAEETFMSKLGLQRLPPHKISLQPKEISSNSVPALSTDNKNKGIHLKAVITKESPLIIPAPETASNSNDLPDLECCSKTDLKKYLNLAKGKISTRKKKVNVKKEKTNPKKTKFPINILSQSEEPRECGHEFHLCSIAAPHKNENSASLNTKTSQSENLSISKVTSNSKSTLLNMPKKCFKIKTQESSSSSSPTENKKVSLNKALSSRNISKEMPSQIKSNITADTNGEIKVQMNDTRLMETLTNLVLPKDMIVNVLRDEDTLRTPAKSTSLESNKNLSEEAIVRKGFKQNNVNLEVAQLNNENNETVAIYEENDCNKIEPVKNDENFSDPEDLEMDTSYTDKHNDYIQLLNENLDDINIQQNDIELSTTKRPSYNCMQNEEQDADTQDQSQTRSYQQIHKVKSDKKYENRGRTVAESENSDSYKPLNDKVGSDPDSKASVFLSDEFDDDTTDFESSLSESELEQHTDNFSDTFESFSDDERNSDYTKLLIGLME